MTMSLTERHAVVHRVHEVRTRLSALLAGKIIVLASYKGGAGKSTLAREFAWLLSAVLVDFEHDHGAVSRAMGYLHERHKTAPLVDSMLSGGLPRLSSRPHCPLFVPGHPDWEANTPSEADITLNLEHWAQSWQVPVVVDTHPGGTTATRAAMAAAHLVVTPVELAEFALNAAEGMLTGDLSGFPVLIVPNKVKERPLERHIARVERIAQNTGAAFGSPIGRQSWLEDRTLRRPLSAADPMPVRNVPLVNQLIVSAEEAARVAV